MCGQICLLCSGWRRVPISVCPAKAAEHNTPFQCRHVWVPCEAGLPEEAGRLEQGCGHSCPAQTEEEQEGEEAATGARCSGL